MQRTLAIVGLAMLIVATAACSGGVDHAEPPSRPRPRIDIDPEDYVTDYQSPTREDGGGMSGRSYSSAAPSSRPPGAAVPVEPRPPGFLEDNTFTHPGASPFVRTTSDPRSTFALDVDTGSYSVARTFLRQGYRPDPASVRTEEWVNAFDGGQRPPTKGDLGVTVDGAASPFTGDGTRLVRIGVRARDVTEAQRPAANLTFVVDTSGSMDIRNRLGLAKASLALLVRNLRDDDTISIVTFSDEAGVVLEPTPVRHAQTIIDAIDRLSPGNSTNLEAGLRTGYQQAQRSFRKGGINALILASDGVANVGTTGPGSLAAQIQKRSLQGIHLVTVGYGMGNYNDTTMEQLADRGDGFYSYVDTYREAERLFGHQLTSTLSVVADDAKAQVTFDPRQVSAYRLVGYDNRAVDDDQFQNDKIDAGEIGAGHTVTALYEIRPSSPVALASAGPSEATAERQKPVDLGRVALRYRSTATGRVVAQTTPIRVADLAPTFARATPGLRLAATVAGLAEVLGQHPVAAERHLDLGKVEAVARQVASDQNPSAVPGKATATDLLSLIDRAKRARRPR